MLTLNFHPFPELSTERLRLRQINNEDANDLLVLRSDKKVMQFIDRPLAQTTEDALQLIRKIHNDEEVTVHGNEKHIGGRFYIYVKNHADAVLHIIKNL